MKKIYYIIPMAFLLLSCSSKENKNVLMDTLTPKELTKLEKLMLLPKDSVIAHYDLSHDSLTQIPNISKYTILSLDLSYNQIDTILAKNLPQKLEKLNLSHNKFAGIVRIHRQTISFLKEINLSYNKLTFLDCGEPLYRILISLNNVTDMSLNHQYIRYLDISYNPNFSNRVTNFNPDRIDTIVRKGIANNREIYNPFSSKGGIMFSSSASYAKEVIRKLDEKYKNRYADSVEYRKVKRPPLHLMYPKKYKK